MNKNCIKACLACMNTTELNNFLQQNGLCDIELKFGSESIRTNKALLAAQSSYFDAMFNGPMREAQADVINITSDAHQDFSQVLECQLFGNIKLSADNIAELTRLAHYYQFDETLRMCEGWIVRHHSSFDADCIYDLAMTYDLAALKSLLVVQILEAVVQNKPIDQQKLQLLLNGVNDLDLTCFKDLPDAYQKSLAHCHSLKSLNLSNCKWVNDTTLSYLSGLTKLEKLELFDCYLQDLSPLASLTNLRFLDLGYQINGRLGSSQIVDIAPLASLINLEHLILQDRGKDLGILQNLTKLKFLDLFGIYNLDLSFIGSLSELEHLNLSTSKNLSEVKQCKALKFLKFYCPLNSDVSFIADLKELEALVIDGRVGIGLDACSHLPKLATLRLLSQSPGTDISKIAKLISLKNLKLDISEGADISTLSSFSRTVNLFQRG